MEPLMAAAAEPADTLRVGRSGGYRLIVATQWESIKIGRTQRVSVASIRHVAAQSATVDGLTQGPSRPAGWQHRGWRRKQAMCSPHDLLWTTVDVAAFLMYGPTAARQLLQIAARRGPRWPPSEGSQMSERKMIMERLLSVAEAADRLGTTARFPRRLIAERRIRFVRVGRHIRIPESAIGEFIAAGTVQPITSADVS